MTIQTELTPELSEKILRGIMERRNDELIAKKEVLCHLNQLKAQMGKMAKNSPTQFYRQGVLDCMEAIDKKIAKIKNQ